MTANAIFTLPGAGNPFPISPALARVHAVIAKAGGRAVVVGGAVRDHLLGVPCKDVDLEVFSLDLAPLETALREVGAVHAVGRAFGVLKVRVEEGDQEFDVALPRRESKIGTGHRGFVVQSDGEMTFEQAAARRDFTLNALGFDLDTQSLLDPYRGEDDLRSGCLRHVSEAFDEDPLRVLRACQFAARFSLSIAPETLLRCHHLEGELSTLPSERWWEELKKLLLRAPFPSVGLSALKNTRALSLFPELAALVGVKQEPDWHPEGDVWVHTLLVVDAAAQLLRNESDENERLIGLFAALCHDFGKPSTTTDADGVVRSRAHDIEGEAPTRTFLERLGAPKALVNDVVPLVREHLRPYQLYADRQNVGDGALRRLALRVPIHRLLTVARADFLGRTTKEALCGVDHACDWLAEQCIRLDVEKAAPKPLLLGRHLLDIGFVSGPHLGPLLKQTFHAQLDGQFTDLDGALKWARRNLVETL